MNTDPLIFEPFSSTYVDFEPKMWENYSAFGALHLHVNKFQSTTKAVDFNFQIDNSASMMFLCADGGKKQEHVNFTADKMMRYLQTHNIDATVSVCSFDDAVVSVVETQQLTQANIEEISYKINQIKPRGATNIASVLENEVTWTKRNPTPTKERIFFLFTDGQATCGPTTSHKDLIRISQGISLDTTIVTIGCGTDHDFNLLRGITERKKGTHKFIGNIEEVSFACGEILDSIINKILENCEIRVLNGQIWDWKKNEWVQKIAINNVVGECDKTYHVRSLSPASFRATFLGTIAESGLPFQWDITHVNENQDVRKHKYRQETLELLHETNVKGTNPDVYTSPECMKELKRKLKDFTVNIKAFMDENDLRDDAFMQTLCSDIFVCYSSIGTQYGHMFTSSRQTSQATQGIHTNMCTYNGAVTQIPVCSRQITRAISFMQSEEEEEEDDVPPMRRLPSGLRFCSMAVEEDQEDADSLLEEQNEKEEKDADEIMFNHRPISNYLSPYANDKTMGIIRAVSVSPDM